MKHILKKSLSIMCAALIVFGFLDTTPVSAETTEVDHLQMWKECRSVDELEAFLGTKYSPSSTVEDRWKNIKILTHNGNSWKFLDASKMYFIRPSNSTYNDKWYTDIYGNGISFGKNCLTSASDAQIETLEKGYLILNDNTNDNLSFSATGVNTSDYDKSGQYPNELTFQIKFNDSVYQKFQGKPSFTEGEFAYRSSAKVTDICYTVTTSTDKTNTMNASQSTGDSNDHCYFNLVAMSGVSAEYDSCWGSYAGFVSSNAYYFSYVDWVFTDTGISMYVSSQVREPQPLGASDSRNWFMIYLPVGESITTAIKMASMFSDGDWYTVWDWKSFYKWKNSSTSYGRMCIYREITGNYSVETQSSVVYSGDLYIPAGQVWTIPEGSTVIISSECTLLVDGEIRNNGTLIIQPGATVTYFNRDLNNHDMIVRISTLTQGLAGYNDAYTTERTIYQNLFDYSLAFGLDLKTNSYLKNSYTTTYDVALFKNGIINTGNLVIRSGSKVDIPRLTQYGDGKTWLSGTMLVEEIFDLGTDISTATYNAWTDGDSFEMTYSTNVDNASYNFNIDDGTLYLLQYSKADDHTQLWVANASEWGNLIEDNDAVLHDGAPLQAILGTGNSFEEGFNIFGSNVTIKNSIKGAAPITNMKGYK